ncbi:MAG: PqqD family protein [Alphaproteobacteria bacterium]|nr:PqqD family protein [Alphaproteobacteria bacterium]
MQRYALNPRVSLEFNAKDGTHILVDTRSATLCSCNGTAWSLLNQLREGCDIEALSDLVVQKYGIDLQRARTDILGFVHKLGAMGLIDETA